MVEKKGKNEGVCCPVGTFFEDLEKAFGKKSPFYKHMNQSKIEFLKGIISRYCQVVINVGIHSQQSILQQIGLPVD